tara:strand:+ start:848 stop:1297 length:450 start_codon:yes stop_codon:yes gene_type:complete
MLKQFTKNKNLIVSDSSIMLVDILSQYADGKFRHIVKTKLGMTCVDARDFDNPRMMENPEYIINGYKNGVLQTVQFQPSGTNTWLTIFSRTGKKVKLIDESILVNLTVGTINNLYYNTNLYSHQQYKSVNSKSWASMAYQMNEEVAVTC